MRKSMYTRHKHKLTILITYKAGVSSGERDKEKSGISVNIVSYITLPFESCSYFSQKIKFIRIGNLQKLHKKTQMSLRTYKLDNEHT